MSLGCGSHEESGFNKFTVCDLTRQTESPRVAVRYVETYNLNSAIFENPGNVNPAFNIQFKNDSGPPIITHQSHFRYKGLE